MSSVSVYNPDEFLDQPDSSLADLLDQFPVATMLARPIKNEPASLHEFWVYGWNQEALSAFPQLEPTGICLGDLMPVDVDDRLTQLGALAPIAATDQVGMALSTAYEVWLLESFQNGLIILALPAHQPLLSKPGCSESIKKALVNHVDGRPEAVDDGGLETNQLKLVLARYKRAVYERYFLKATL